MAGVTADFLLELRSEEIPARMQAGARNDLARLFAEELDRAGLASQTIDVFSTPRRLALIARGLPLETESRTQEIKGPRTSAPPQALDGFLRKTGLNRGQLEERDGVFFATIDAPGQPTRDLLGPMVERIVGAFPWPKSMRWGAASASPESLRWVRPLQGIVAMLGEEIVPVAIDGIESGATTVGHRFHHPGPITVGGASDYAEKLRACHVIVDQEERERVIRDGAAKAAADAGLALVEDEGLVVENAGLTEWPVPLLGRFDPDYLDVPREVIVLTMRSNQKYFACTVPPRDGEGDHAEHGGGGGVRAKNPLRQPLAATSPSGGGLAPAFVCVANIDAKDGGASIVEGNRRVLAARLADARFFWEQDVKVPLEEQAQKLNGIVFHEKLGTVADKVERVARLARWLVEEGIVTPEPSTVTPAPFTVTPAQAGVQGGAATAATDSRLRGNDEAVAALADLAEQAARLAKADLVTEMVGEFPELQGLMGGYYARAEGLPPQVADAIRDHYKPVGQGDEVPTAPVTVAVSLADKLDTLAGFFVLEQGPTGSRDPFALRRAALSCQALLLRNALRIHLLPTIEKAVSNCLNSIAMVVRRNEEAVAKKLFPNAVSMRTVSEKVRLKNPADGKEYGKTAFVVLDFFADRLKVQQREAGVRHDLIDAVFALGGEDDLVRLLARVKALQSFVGTEDGANLLAGYKRAANILRKEDWLPTAPPLQGRGRSAEGAGGVGDVVTAHADRPHPNPSPEGEGLLDTEGIAQTGEEDPLALVDDPDLAPVIAAKMAERKKNSLSYMPEPAEDALIAALDSAEPEASAAVEAEDFAAAMRSLASLRAPIDRFFDEVTVNDPDRDKRAARLDLLLRFRDAVHRVADFSKIEG